METLRYTVAVEPQRGACIAAVDCLKDIRLFLAEQEVPGLSAYYRKAQTFLFSGRLSL
jgi:hypothetical protein